MFFKSLVNSLNCFKSVGLNHKSSILASSVSNAVPTSLAFSFVVHNCLLNFSNRISSLANSFKDETNFFIDAIVATVAPIINISDPAPVLAKALIALPPLPNNSPAVLLTSVKLLLALDAKSRIFFFAPLVSNLSKRLSGTFIRSLAFSELESLNLFISLTLFLLLGVLAISSLGLISVISL